MESTQCLHQNSHNGRSMWRYPHLAATQTSIGAVIGIMSRHLRHRVTITTKRASKVLATLVLLLRYAALRADTFSDFGHKDHCQYEERKE